MMPQPISSTGGLFLRGFLSISTIVMLVAHAMLGCCVHHVHATREACDPAGLVDGFRGLDAHHCPSVVSPGQCCDERQQREDCQESKCDFGRPSKTRAAKSRAVLFQFVALPLPSGSLDVVGSHLERHLCTSGDQRLPARLHLLHQVLLI